LGSSGVGKSTLTNYLLGFESQKTQEVSADSRGRHTTTARNLRFTRWGGLVIDTPGMQEIATLDPEEELQNNFSDIDELTLRCKFTNCQHKSEPGCAILSALKKETLTTQRWNMYLAAVDQASRRR
jgi:ribosome biogenesis GTPase